MREFINTLSMNDKIILLYSMLMLSIGITELILFVIRFLYAWIVYHKRLPDHRISGYRFINTIERLKSYVVINALMSYLVIVFGVKDSLILKAYIVTNTTIVYIAVIMHILCVSFGYMLKINVNKEDYFITRLEAYDPNDDGEATK